MSRGLTRIAAMAVALIACSITACTAGASVHNYHERFEHGTLPAVDITLLVTPWQQRYQSRYLGAARTALRLFGEWYGPYPDGTLTIDAAGTQASSAADHVAVNAHALSPPSARVLEHQVVRAVARRFWSGSLAPDLSVAPGLADALIDFSVNRLMRETYSGALPTELRFIDQTVPWVVRSVSPGWPPPGSGRALLALVTLERYLGWPTFQQTVAQFRGQLAGRPASGADLIALAGEISGRDLSWMEGLFDPSRVYDYGIDRIETRRATDGAFDVEVVVRRYGDGLFSGRVLPRVGPFESGRGVTLSVAFADGHDIVETWDGRDEERRFVYRSRAPVISATVDADGIISVDTSRANNFLTTERGGTAAQFAWAARWAVWLQDRLLLWSALI